MKGFGPRAIDMLNAVGEEEIMRDSINNQKSIIIFYGSDEFDVNDHKETANMLKGGEGKERRKGGKIRIQVASLFKNPLASRTDVNYGFRTDLSYGGEAHINSTNI